jgi:hypothetical protein
MSDLRAQVCQVISSLSPNCSKEQVSAELDPLFDSVSNKYKLSFESQISPLAVACDKSNSRCLEYLLEKRSVNQSTFSKFIGSPLDEAPDTANAAIHHAAMSGCYTAISILMKFDDSLSIIDLVSSANSHGDTPLMMAAAGGHVKFLQKVEEIYSLLFDHHVTHHEDLYYTCQLKKVLLIRNSSNDSCLSLACCHGWPMVVEFLLTLSPVETELLQTCQQRYVRMKEALDSSPELMKQNRKRLDSVQECLNILETKLSRIAEETASKLLAEEALLQPKARKKKKKKKQGRNKGSRKQSKPEDNSLSFSKSNIQDRYNDENMILTTLADGTVAVSIKGEELEGRSLRFPSNALSMDQSVDEMFRKRFEGGVSEEVDAVMNALCLDVSMLLYTPHGMALNLSPSQLEAVQRILEEQLVAVEEARSIQNRMHSTYNND